MPPDFRRRRFIEDFDDEPRVTSRGRFREEFEEEQFLPSSRSMSTMERFDTRELDRPVTRRDLEEFVRELRREGRSEDFIEAVRQNPSKARLSAMTRREFEPRTRIISVARQKQLEAARQRSEQKPKRKSSPKQRAAARRNIQKALAARRKKRRSRR